MATRTWKGGGTTANPKSGNWGTSANWSPAGVPAAGDDVVIDGSGAYTVTLNGNTAALNALTINNSAATLVIATFTLHVSGTGASAINVRAGQITIAGGTVNDAGGMTLASGAGVTGAGALKISGHYTGAGLLQASGGTLDVFGTIDSGIALQIASASASILKIEGTGTAVAAVAISGANQTLEVGASGNLTINAVESISNGTIHLIGGTLTAASGIAILGIIIVLLDQFFSVPGLVKGWSSTVIIVLFIGGVQLICIGIIGEYVGRIYGESKRRPLYIVRERMGFDAPEQLSVRNIRPRISASR